MRIEGKAVAAALVAGGVVYLVAKFGLFRGIAISAPFGLAVVCGMAIGFFITMAQNLVTPQELVKQKIGRAHV